jgi:hypothetical protein
MAWKSRCYAPKALFVISNHFLKTKISDLFFRKDLQCKFLSLRYRLLDIHLTPLISCHARLRSTPIYIDYLLLQSPASSFDTRRNVNSVSS